MKIFLKTLLLSILMTLSISVFSQDVSFEDLSKRANEAEVLRREGKVEDALKILNEILASKPKFFLPYYSRALIYMSKDQWKLAASDLDSSLAEAPDIHPIRFNRAFVSYRMEKYEEAVTHLSKILEKSPFNWDALSFRAHNYILLRKYESAEADLARHLQENPDDTNGVVDMTRVKLALGKNQDVLAVSETHLRKNGNCIVPLLIARANATRALLQPKETLWNAKQILRCAPIRDQSALASYFFQASAYNELSMFGKAVDAALKGLETKSDDKAILFQLSLSFIQLEAFETGLTILEKAWSKDERDPYSYNNRAYANIRINKLDEALPDLKKAFELKPNMPFAKNNLGLIYLKQGKLDAARVEIEEARKLSPGIAHIEYNLGRVYMAEGKFAIAESLFTTAIEKEPLWFFYVERAKARKALKRIVKAKEDEQEANKLRDELRVVRELALKMLKEHEDK